MGTLQLLKGLFLKNKNKKNKPKNSQTKKATKKSQTTPLQQCCCSKTSQSQQRQSRCRQVCLLGPGELSCPHSGTGRGCSWSSASPQVLQWVGGGWRCSPAADSTEHMCGALLTAQPYRTFPLPWDINLPDALNTANGVVRRGRWNYRKGVAGKWKQELWIVGCNVVRSHTSSAHLLCSTGCYFQQMFVSKIPI